jgi:hypothetical protein
MEGFLKIAFGRPLLSEPLFAGRTTVARSERLFNCKVGGSFVGAATSRGLAPPEILSNTSTVEICVRNLEPVAENGRLWQPERSQRRRPGLRLT